jgi:hypothetical protein
MANFLYNGVVVTSREGTMSMSYDLLQLGIALSQSGRKQEANEIFGTLIHNDRFNETAWIWFIFTLETDPEKIAGLEEFLTVFPDHTTARKALATLREEAKPSMSHPQPIENAQGKAMGIPPTGLVPVREVQPVRKSQPSLVSLLLVILAVCILLLGPVTFVKRYNAQRARIKS